MSNFDTSGCEEAFNDEEMIAECEEAVSDGDVFFNRTAIYHGEYTGRAEMGAATSEDEMVREAYINSKPTRPDNLDPSDLDGPHEGEGIYVLPTGSWGYLEI